MRDGFIKGDVEIVVPDLLLYEIANALKHNPHFSETDVKKALESLYEIGLPIVDPVLDVVKSSIDIGFRFNASIYDAFYVALAQELDFTFVTADRHLYEKVKDLGFVKFITDL